MTFWDLVSTAADDAPDRVVVADDFGRSLTSLQLRDAAERVAAGLGVRPGQVVSWQLPTTLEAVVVLAALARVGAVQNPIIPVLRESEVALITTQLATELLIVPETWRGFSHGAMARDLDGIEVIALDLEGDVGPELRLPQSDPSELAAPPTDDDAVRWIYYSSGTTAAPKGARHTDASVMSSAVAITDHLGFGAGDRYPIAWPVTHIGGITVLTACLRAGGALVVFDRFDQTTPERMATHRPTVLGSAQPFFRAYLDAQAREGDEPLYPELRVCTAGGAPTPAEIVHELEQVFGVHGVVQAWGLTEFPMATCASPDDSSEALLLTSGRPVAGAAVRVVDGELRLRGPQCFQGYVDATLDAEAFDDDGWFRTGDLGHVDGDGNVHITGRLKDIIIRNAENISALEVESALLTHPDVVDVAVIGLPDVRTGERVAAVVVAAENSALTLEVIADHCRGQGLARQKTPEALQIVTAIPRNPMGKVLKQQLRDEFVLESQQ